MAVVTPSDTVTVDINAPRQLRRNTAPPPQLFTSPPLRPKPSHTTAAINATASKSVNPSPRKKRRLVTVSSRGRRGRPRRVEAEAYPCHMDVQDVVPVEAYPTSTVNTSSQIDVDAQEIGSSPGKKLSVSQQLVKVGYGSNSSSSSSRSSSENSDLEGGGEDEAKNSIKPQKKSEKSPEEKNSSDDELASLRGSKGKISSEASFSNHPQESLFSNVSPLLFLVKFVRIKEHESPNSSVIESTPQHYVICQSHETTPKASFQH